LLSINSWADNWQLVKNKNQISIYKTSKPNYKLNLYKAEVIINKDSDTILAALQDTQACSQWVYNCISNKMVDMTDVSNRIYHTIIHSPLWFKDRDIYLQSNVTLNLEERLFTISFDSKPEHAKETKDKVRITDVEMIWSLKFLANDSTLVTYQVYIDPKLPIKAINNKMIQKSIFQTMLGLTIIVENPVYAETKYSESELKMLTEDR
jgi:hypothetical protein